MHTGDLASGVRFSAFAQESARHPQRSFSRLDIDGLGEHKVRTHAISLGDARLSFDEPNGQRPLIERGVARTLDHERGALFVLAVNDNCIVMLRHQTFYRGKRVADGRHGEFEFTEELAYDPGEFLISAEKESLVTHDEPIVGRPVSTGKLRA